MGFLEQLSAALPEGCALKDLLPMCDDALWDINPQAAAVFALAKTGMFDTQEYLDRYQDVRNSGCDPISHFVEYGLAEGRNFRLKIRDNSQCRVFARDGEWLAPKISVLMPVYNNARYLRECIESVAGQTLKEIEIIVIDDGSDDPEAVRIMDEYAQLDTRIHVVHKINTGYGHSMNVGLDRAQGKYIAIVESDDYIHPEMLEKHYQLAEEHSLDMVKSDPQAFYGEKDSRVFEEKDAYHRDARYGLVLDPQQELELLHSYNVIWNGIYNHGFLKRNNIRFNETPGASYQDNGFWFQTMIFARRVMYARLPGYFLRRDNEGSSFYSKDKAMCMCDEYEFIYGILKKNPLLYELFIRHYHSKKYSNYIFTLQRVAESHRAGLITQYMREFREADERGELDKNVLGARLDSIRHIIDGSYSCSWIRAPEVSVILPVYNGAAYLEECLRDLETQTLKNIEILCIDDGSTDNTGAILKEHAGKDRRIRVFKQKNHGAGSARNACLARAQGNYVIFLDADDRFGPTFLREMQERIHSQNADICVCRSENLDMGTLKTSEIKYAIRQEQLPETGSFNPGEIRGSIFKAFVGWAWDKMYRRGFVEENNLKFQELSSTNDMYFVFATLLLADSITILDRKLVTHRRGLTSSVSNTREKNPFNFLKALEEIKKLLISRKLFDKYEKDFKEYMQHAYKWNLDTLRGEAAVRLYNMANWDELSI